MRLFLCYICRKEEGVVFNALIIRHLTAPYTAVNKTARYYCAAATQYNALYTSPCVVTLIGVCIVYIPYIPCYSSSTTPRPVCTTTILHLTKQCEDIVTAARYIHGIAQVHTQYHMHHPNTQYTDIVAH